MCSSCSLHHRRRDLNDRGRAMAPGQYSMDAKQHTMSPVVTGATVIGMKYKDGVILAADTLASYGNEARYKDVCRLKKIGDHTLLGAGGEISDFQYLGDLLDEMADEEACDARSVLVPAPPFPLQDQAPHLMYVDHQGTAFEEDFVATGFGMHLGIPLLRNNWKPDMSLDEAKALATKCLEVCFYRDCKAYCKIQIGVCAGAGVEIGPPTPINHFWGHTAWTENRLEDGDSTGTW
ncbi:Proteasome subunit beta type-4 [Symbiodinium microadriaticum]|uniref:Proteasome subunit beta n=1 Tax=Symbiodinium microadriaticum TaxID=2951 RepID=A0A1Q9DIA9_SYMMI|nr:Proteasome subunit beta type-4 [Symbiodinium microadriaticum]